MADTALSEQTDSDKPERVCAWCGADISHRGPRALTCSKQCKGKRDNKLKTKYTRKALAVCRCKVCEATFEHRNPRARLCSMQCKQKARRAASKAAAKRRKNERKSNPVVKVCDWCGSSFTLERSRGVVYRQTCSDTCAREKKNSRWRKMLQEMPAHKRDERRSVHRQWERKRAAEQSLALLILPIEETHQ